MTVNATINSTIDILTNSFLTLDIHETTDIREASAVLIQKHIRGWLCRIGRLPTILYMIQNYLKSLDSTELSFCSENADGRINSCTDEDNIINLLSSKFGDKIKKPKIRMWYDILVHDRLYGWMPVNIKTTTTLTTDNTGNLAMCVYAYTNHILNIHNAESFNNGAMSKILYTKLKSGEFNINDKKDYYFIVMNKTNKSDVIVNSAKGLSILTPNINNLPFQVCWNKNRQYNHKSIHENVKLFAECLQKPKPSWKDTFMNNMRTLEL